MMPLVGNGNTDNCSPTIGYGNRIVINHHSPAADLTYSSQHTPRPTNNETSNVTGRHRGPKQKLQAGYRALSRHRHAMSGHSYFSIGCPRSLYCMSYCMFIIECGIAHFLCTMRTLWEYSKVGHHPHPLG